MVGVSWDFYYCTLSRQKNPPPSHKTPINHTQNTKKKREHSNHTSIQPTIIRNHQHHIPLENIIIHQPAANPWIVLVALHLLQLSREQACRCRARHVFGSRGRKDLYRGKKRFSWRGRRGAGFWMDGWISKIGFGILYAEWKVIIGVIHNRCCKYFPWYGGVKECCDTLGTDRFKSRLRFCSLLALIQKGRHVPGNHMHGSLPIAALQCTDNPCLPISAV